MAPALAPVLVPVLAMVLAACTSTPTAPASPTDVATAVRSPDASTEDLPPPRGDRGPELVAAEVRPRTPGIAWQLDDAVLLTTTAGTAIGHLVGWSLDRAGSDRLAAPVLDGPDGPHVVTVDRLVPLADPLPLAGRHTLVVRDGVAEVRGPDDATVAELSLMAADELWVSATGSVVGVVDGDHWDVEAAAPTDVPAGCRVADRHTPDAPTLVCDDGARLVGTGSTEVAAPDGRSWGWVTVGTTGDEVLATTSGGEGPATWAGSLSAGSVEPRHDPGVGLFFRSSGDAWVAHLGPGSGLDVLVGLERTERVADVPPASDAAMWTR